LTATKTPTPTPLLTVTAAVPRPSPGKDDLHVSNGGNYVIRDGVYSSGPAWELRVKGNAAATVAGKPIQLVGDPVVAQGATWTSGVGAPSGWCQTGNLYTDRTGGTGTTLYVCEATGWAAK
jgi:hypothetical protein